MLATRPNRHLLKAIIVDATKTVYDFDKFFGASTSTPIYVSVGSSLVEAVAANDDNDEWEQLEAEAISSARLLAIKNYLKRTGQASA